MLLVNTVCRFKFEEVINFQLKNIAQNLPEMTKDFEISVAPQTKLSGFVPASINETDHLTMVLLGGGR